jgi:hypothetical protein
MATKKVVDEVAVEEVPEVEGSVEIVLASGQETKKLVHPDGRVAYVHESMIPAYLSGGFEEE